MFLSASQRVGINVAQWVRRIQDLMMAQPAFVSDLLTPRMWRKTW